MQTYSRPRPALAVLSSIVLGIACPPDATAQAAGGVPPVAAASDSSVAGGSETASPLRFEIPLVDKPCRTGTDDGTIVVCGRNEENARQRLPLHEEDPRRATNDGLPRAPNVFGIPDIGGVKVTGCFMRPCPPPVMPDINFAALPQAPEGSDADRIARGEIRAP